MEAETCFEDEHKHSSVIFVFGDWKFSAHKGPNNPKHHDINLVYGLQKLSLGFIKAQSNVDITQ